MSYTDGEMAYLLPGTLREEILRWQREIEERNAASRAAWGVFRDALTEIWEASTPEGESPILSALRAQQAGSTAYWEIQVVPRGPRGVPRQEVNLSREAMDLLANVLDTTLEHYGTSGDADPRGYWMPIDGDTR